MKRFKKARKASQNQEFVFSNDKVNKLLEKMLQIVKKYKELGVVVGAVSVCLWNIICSAYYRAYALGLGVDEHYIQNDSHSLITSILVFAVGLLFAVPLFKMLFKQMEINETGVKPTVLSILKSFLYIALSLLIIIIIGMICKWRMVIELVAAPMVLIAFFTASILVSFIQLLLRLVKSINKKRKLILKKIKAKNVDDNNEPQEASSDGSEDKKTNCPEKKQQSAETNKLWLCFMAFAMLLAIVFFAYFLFFAAGMYKATSRVEFRFLVEDLNCEISATTNSYNTNLILSETDDYYCLAEYEVKENDGSEMITIISSRQTIIPKSELKDKVFIVQKRFENAQFVKSYV